MIFPSYPVASCHTCKGIVPKHLNSSTAFISFPNQILHCHALTLLTMNPFVNSMACPRALLKCVHITLAYIYFQLYPPAHCQINLQSSRASHHCLILSFPRMPVGHPCAGRCQLRSIYQPTCLDFLCTLSFQQEKINFKTVKHRDY